MLFLVTVSSVLLVNFGLCSDPTIHHGVDLHGFLTFEAVADPLLDGAKRQIFNLESRERSHLDQLSDLLKVADANLDFVNEYQAVHSATFLDKQKIQDTRLNALGDKIAQIQTLRQRVQDLQTEAGTVNDKINNGVYSDRKQIMYDVAHLQNLNLEQKGALKETQNRADAVDQRTDTLYIKICDNLDVLYELKYSARILVDIVNANRAFESFPTVFPGDEELATEQLCLEPPTLGVAQGQFFSMVGFHAVLSHKYDRGYPSLYLGAFYQMDNAWANITGTDMSSGGWSATAISTELAGIYFGTSFRRDFKSSNSKPGSD